MPASRNIPQHSGARATATFLDEYADEYAALRPEPVPLLPALGSNPNYRTSCTCMSCRITRTELGQPAISGYHEYQRRPSLTVHAVRVTVGAHYDELTFTQGDLSHAYLPGMEMTLCNLNGVDFSDTVLQDSVFKQCDLRGVDFRRADITGVVFDRCLSDSNTRWNENVPMHHWSRLTNAQRDGLQNLYGIGHRFPADVLSADDPPYCGNCDNPESECSCGSDDNDDNDVDSYTNLYNYSTNVIHKCGWPSENTKKALVFGVELEMEAKRDNGRVSQQDMVEALGGPKGPNFICKYDGSLSSGVELVTLPYTLDQHRTKFGWAELLAPMAALARSGKGTSNCGIHIHANKKALSALTIGKLLVLHNCPGMRALISAIAQRSSNEFCQRGHKKLTDGNKPRVSRYDILNVADNTIEWRMFRGNLRADRVLKNLEWVHATIIYCQNASLQDIESWKNLTQWIITHRGEYPNLVRFCVEKRIPGFGQLGRYTDVIPTEEI